MGGKKRNELRKNDHPTVISLLAVGAYAPYRDSWTHAHLSQRGRETLLSARLLARGRIATGLQHTYTSDPVTYIERTTPVDLAVA